MSEQRVVKANPQIFGCSIFPTIDYLLGVVGLNSTNEFLNINKETLKTSHNNLNGDVDKGINADSRVECGVMTIKELDCMALAINLLTRRGRNPDATLLVTLDQYEILHFKRVMRHMVTKKSNMDDVDTTKLPKNTQPKN